MEAITNGYLTRAKLKAAIGDTTYVHDAEHDRAIEAASRTIDLWTGRYFWREPAPAARLFRADPCTWLHVHDRTTVCVGDFDSTAGLTVETDDDADGVFETPWKATEWQAEPLVRYNNWPYTKITTTTRTREFPLDSRRARVRVTTTWGWGQIPLPVEQACEILSTLFYRSKDWSGASFGLHGQGAGQEKVSADPISVAMRLVEQYAVKGGTLYKPPQAA